MLSNYHASSSAAATEGPSASVSYTFGGFDNDLNQQQQQQWKKKNKSRWGRRLVGGGGGGNSKGSSRGSKVKGANNRGAADPSQSIDSMSYSVGSSSTMTSIAMDSAGQSTVDSSTHYTIPHMLKQQKETKTKQQKQTVEQIKDSQRSSPLPTRQYHFEQQDPSKPLSLSKHSVNSSSQISLQSLQYSTDNSEVSSVDFSFVDDGSHLEGTALLQQHLLAQKLSRDDSSAREEENGRLSRTNKTSNTATNKRRSPIKPNNHTNHKDVVDSDDNDDLVTVPADDLSSQGSSGLFDDVPDDESKPTQKRSTPAALPKIQSSADANTTTTHRGNTTKQHNNHRGKLIKTNNTPEKKKTSSTKQQQQSPKGIADFDDFQAAVNDFPRWCCGGLACFL